MALIAWVLTQIHLIRLGRQIDTRINDGRQRTEAFVNGGLDRVERTFKERVAELQAAIPEAPEASMGELRAELSDFAKKVGEDMGWMKTQWGQLMADRSNQVQELSKIAGEEAQRMRQELGAASQALAPQLQGDPRAAILKIIQREPTAKEKKEMGWLGELASAAMKKGLYDWLNGGQLSSGNGRYSISTPAGDGW